MSLDEKNLDGLLKKAKWPKVSAESKERLEEFWQETWRGRLRLRWLPLAAAATIAIGIGAGILLMLNPPRFPPAVVSVNPTPQSADKTRIWQAQRETILAEARNRELSQGRSMTLRERMMLGDMRPKRVAPAATQKVKVEEPAVLRDPQLLAEMVWGEKDQKKERELIAELLRGQSRLAVSLYLKMVVDAKHRQVALAALDDVKDPPVEAFIDELGNSRVAVRFAAARVLGKIDGPETTRELVGLIERNTQKREALAALMYSRGTDAAEFIDGARNVPGLAVTVRAVEIQMKNTQ